MPYLFLDGSDPDYFYLSVESFTDPGREYAVTICKRQGEMRCDCLDYSCRKKRGDLLDPTRGCKHIRMVHAALQELS